MIFSNLKKRYIGDAVFYRRVFSILIPIVLQNFITTFVSLLDNIMVGQVGTEPMSGVAIVNQLLFVFNLAMFGIVSGGSVFAAQFFGKGDHKGVGNTFKVKLYSTILLIVVTLALVFTLSDEMIMMFIHEGEAGLDLQATFDYAKEYLSVMLLGIIPFGFSQAYSSTLREVSEARVPMIAGFTAVAVNLVGNYILIYGKFGAPKLGVVGAAIATVASRYVEFLIVVIWTHTHTDRVPFAKGVYKSLVVPKALLKQIIKLGIPMFLNELLWGAGQTFLNQILSVRGLEVVSANNISSTVSQLFSCVYLAIGVALSIIIGQVLGAGDPERAVDEDRKIIALSFMITLVISLIMHIFTPVIPEIYNTTPEVKALATLFIRALAFHLPLAAVVNALYYTIRSGGRTFVTFLFDSCYSWCICIVTEFILVHFTNLGPAAIYAIVLGLDLIKFTVGTILVRKRIWVVNLIAKNNL